eukprot:Sspe_Gene.11692::Locus_3964_Transcript_1_1_Confidence_1.000_Length_2091::g.11692::m.11692
MHRPRVPPDGKRIRCYGQRGVLFLGRDVAVGVPVRIPGVCLPRGLPVLRCLEDAVWGTDACSLQPVAVPWCRRERSAEVFPAGYLCPSPRNVGSTCASDSRSTREGDEGCQGCRGAPQRHAACVAGEGCQGVQGGDAPHHHRDGEPFRPRSSAPPSAIQRGPRPSHGVGHCSTHRSPSGPFPRAAAAAAAREGGEGREAHHAPVAAGAAAPQPPYQARHTDSTGTVEDCSADGLHEAHDRRWYLRALPDEGTGRTHAGRCSPRPPHARPCIARCTGCPCPPAPRHPPSTLCPRIACSRSPPWHFHSPRI